MRDQAPDHRSFDPSLEGWRRERSRRQFLSWASRRGVALGVAGVAAPTILAACAGGEDTATVGTTSGTTGTTLAPTLTTVAEAQAAAQVINGDVIDFSLTSDGWELDSNRWTADFGFVTMALHPGVYDGNDVFYIRTDASDQAYASSNGLVFVPRIAPLSEPGLSGEAYFFAGGAEGQATVFSNEPGQPNYTPAWTVHDVTWTTTPRVVTSVAEVEAARDGGELTVERTGVVLNAEIVLWSSGSLPVDEERTAYLGPGQLLVPPDTAAMQVSFKLNQCYPASRYFATSHSLAGPAGATNTILSDGLQGGPSQAGAVGRTNVLMPGLEGPGPMGSQPSVFDFDAGNPAWSPYWDHYTYGWSEGATPRLLTNQSDLFAARDAGELQEFPGAPPTNGTVFTVNCPVPILAPVSYRA